MSDLEITLFGAPHFEVDGSPVELDTRKATALLAYLAVTQQRHTRDALAALLWPENDHSRARAALRRTLSTLNKAIQGAHLAISRQTVELNIESGVRIDTKRFQALIAGTEVHNHTPGVFCRTCVNQLEDAVVLRYDYH